MNDRKLLGKQKGKNSGGDFFFKFQSIRKYTFVCIKFCVFTAPQLVLSLIMENFPTIFGDLICVGSFQFCVGFVGCWFGSRWIICIHLRYTKEKKSNHVFYLKGIIYSV